MKDLTEKIYDELNAQVVRMLEHSLNQASRIADLERQLRNAKFAENLDAEDKAFFASLRAPSAPAVEQQPVAVELAGVHEQIKEGAGFWRSCSGCYETEDGHPVGSYPYSKVLECPLGNGCSECGGIGAIWDNNDYEEMARDWDVEPSAPQAADTDKVREAMSDEKIMSIRDEVWQSVHGDDEYDAMDIAFARAVLKASMAAQAPVREVPEDEWMPIKTAPRDGSHICVSNGASVSVGWFDPGQADAGKGYEGWQDEGGGMLPEPTHWMELPALPATPVQQEGDL